MLDSSSWRRFVTDLKKLSWTVGDADAVAGALAVLFVDAGMLGAEEPDGIPEGGGASDVEETAGRVGGDAE